MERIIETIQKLLALAKSPNEHEAALALAKAQTLLIKHNLSLTAVQGTKESQEELAMLNEIVDFDNYEPWQSTLLNVVATAHFCHVVNTGTESGFHILGRVANVTTVVTLYNWVEPQIIRLARESGYKRGDKTSYIMGIISTIRRKLEDNRQAFDRDNPNSTSLVVAVQQESDKWYRECYPHVTTVRQWIGNGDAYSRGQQDGQRVNVAGSAGSITGRLLLT